MFAGSPFSTDASLARKRACQMPFPRFCQPQIRHLGVGFVHLRCSASSIHKTAFPKFSRTLRPATQSSSPAASLLSVGPSIRMYPGSSILCKSAVLSLCLVLVLRYLAGAIVYVVFAAAGLASIGSPTPKAQLLNLFKSKSPAIASQGPQLRPGSSTSTSTGSWTSSQRPPTGRGSCFRTPKMSTPSSSPPSPPPPSPFAPWAGPRVHRLIEDGSRR